MSTRQRISIDNFAVITPFGPRSRLAIPLKLHSLGAISDVLRAAEWYPSHLRQDFPTEFARGACVERPGRPLDNVQPPFVVAQTREVLRDALPVRPAHFSWELDDRGDGRPRPHIVIADALARTWPDLERAARELADLAGVRANSRSWTDATFPLPGACSTSRDRRFVGGCVRGSWLPTATSWERRSACPAL